jgi:hypothetical protein
MDLPLYQKHLIEAMRAGCNLWMDDLGKTSYHIRLKKAVKNVTTPTIHSLIWHGLLIESGCHLVLTELGLTGELHSSGENKRTLYSI